jgi:branched-chain amino acid aminotransferase
LLQTSLRESINLIIENEKTYEAILVNSLGEVTEGSRSNLFMIMTNSVVTPLSDNILPGITRKYILQVCLTLNISCIQRKVLKEEMFSMQALFITGTSPKVLPVNSICDHKFEVNHPLLRKIMKEFDKLIENYLEQSLNFFKS